MGEIIRKSKFKGQLTDKFKKFKTQDQDVKGAEI
jgi:hypothetical protein